jgi:hypothetical protein
MMTIEIRSLGIKTLGLTTHGIRHYNYNNYIILTVATVANILSCC